MCLSPDSRYFWIGLGVILVLSAFCGWRAFCMFKDVVKARDTEGWASAVFGNGAGLSIAGVWLFVLVSVTRLCI